LIPANFVAKVSIGQVLAVFGTLADGNIGSLSEMVPKITVKDAFVMFR
jgi:hypothetical protein